MFYETRVERKIYSKTRGYKNIYINQKVLKKHRGTRETEKEKQRLQRKRKRRKDGWRRTDTKGRDKINACSW